MVDMELDGAESTYLGMFGQTLEDHSPDAHACRLKLRLALMYCPIKPDDWPIGGLEGLLEDFASYVDKVGPTWSFLCFPIHGDV